MAWDRFAYTTNNPLKYTDPSGHCVIVCSALLGLALGAVINYSVQVVKNSSSGMELNEAVKWSNINKKEFAVATVGGLVGGASLGLASSAISAAGAYIGATGGLTTMATGIIGGGLSNAASNQAEALASASWDQISENSELKFTQDGRGIIEFTPNPSQFYSDAQRYGFGSSSAIIGDFTKGAFIGGVSAGLKLNIIDEGTPSYLYLGKSPAWWILPGLETIEFIEEMIHQLDESITGESDVPQNCITGDSYSQATNNESVYAY